MITWRARTYKPCEAILLAAYMTDRDKSGTRRSPDPKRAGCSRHPRAGPSTAPGASGDDATRHAHDGTTTRPNSRQRQHDPDDLPGRSQTRTVVPGYSPASAICGRCTQIMELATWRCRNVSQTLISGKPDRPSARYSTVRTYPSDLGQLRVWRGTGGLFAAAAPGEHGGVAQVTDVRQGVAG